MNFIKVGGPLLEFLLLNALKGSRTYGYELVSRFAPVYQITSSAIYTALKSLREKGLVNRESEISSGRVRIYYTLNSEGAVYLSNLQDKLHSELEDLKTFCEN